MKSYLLLLLVLVTSALVAADPASTPAARPRLTDALRRRTEEAFVASAKPAPSGAPTNGVVVMAPVRVTGVSPPLPHNPDAQIPKSQPFTWKEGGTLLKHEGSTFTTELKLQYNAQHKGWDILSFSW